MAYPPTVQDQDTHAQGDAAGMSRSLSSSSTQSEQGGGRGHGHGHGQGIEARDISRRDDRDQKRDYDRRAHNSAAAAAAAAADIEEPQSGQLHREQEQRRQSISAHSQADGRSTVTSTPPPFAITASPPTAMPAPAPVSVSVPPPPLSLPGPSSGAIAGGHRESFSRTPVRGSTQPRPSLLEEERRNDGNTATSAPISAAHFHQSPPYNQLPPTSQSHPHSHSPLQRKSQTYRDGDAAAALSSMNPPLNPSTRLGAASAATVTPRSNMSASSHPHPLSRQQDDRVRREQAREYGPGRGHSESYNKLWRDYHNHHEDFPLERASAAGAGSPSTASGGRYENGRGGHGGRTGELEYHGLPMSSPAQSQHLQSQSYPDPRASTSMTPYSSNRLAAHPPDANPMTTAGTAPDYDSQMHDQPPHDEDEPDHDQDNIEEYERPQIWTAVYSNVSVYETIVNSIAVMRRRTDSWLNATQILKVAGVPKARRTKILQALEREVEPHKHEKVQGGYGKYQGTWVEFERGREICREWGVEDVLRPLLELKGEKWDGHNEAYGYPYTQGFAAGFPTKHVKEQQAAQAAAHQQQSSSRQPPTKEEVMAMQRKRIYKGLDQPGNASPVGSNGGNVAPRSGPSGRGNRSPGVAGSTGSGGNNGVPHHASSAASLTTNAAAANASGEGNSNYLQNISTSAVSAMNKGRYESAPQQHGRFSQSSVSSQHQQQSQPQSQSQEMHRRSQSQIQMPPPETITPIAAGTVHHLAETPDELDSGGPSRKRMRPSTEDSGHHNTIYGSENMFDTPKPLNRVSFASGPAGGITPVRSNENMPPPAVPASATAAGAGGAGEPSMSFYRIAQVDGATDNASAAGTGSHPRSLSISSTIIKGLPHLPPATTADRYKKMKLVMTLFLDKKVKDFSDHPAILTLDPIDLEIPLDEHMNTALHWAAMLARMPLITSLVKKGVSIFRLNKNGESALHKAVGTRNNYDYRSFGKLLQVLAPTIELTDGTGRNLLHHICIMAATGGGGHVAARHYLETLLEFLLKQKGKQPTQSSSSAAAGRTQVNELARNIESREIITLDKFMATMINVQDDSGDTPLNIAGRANTSLVAQLIELGADAWIPNHSGLKPADYGVGVDLAGKLRRSRDEGVVEGLAHSQRVGGDPGMAVAPGPGHLPGPSGQGTKTSANHSRSEASDERILRQNRKSEVRDAAIREISSLLHNSIEEYARALTLRTSHKHAATRRWHERIRESARARQAEQKELAELNWRQRSRLELERRIGNLESSKRVLKEKLEKNVGGKNVSDEMNLDEKENVAITATNQKHSQALWKIGHADRAIGIDMEKFKEVFPDGLAALSAAAEQLAPLDTTTTTAQNQTQQSAPAPPEPRPPSPSDPRAEPPPPPQTTASAHSPAATTTSSTTFTPAQSAYLSTLPSRAILKRILAAYTANNQHLMAEIDALKSKNVALGDTYRRIVMACTGWTAKQVDEAAEGLTECVKEINESPVPEEEAIEILMKERGQDW